MLSAPLPHFAKSLRLNPESMHLLRYTLFLGRSRAQFRLINRTTQTIPSLIEVSHDMRSYNSPRFFIGSLERLFHFDEAKCVRIRTTNIAIHIEMWLDSRSF
jgi:hypothetical protein